MLLSPEEMFLILGVKPETSASAQRRAFKQVLGTLSWLQATSFKKTKLKICSLSKGHNS